MTKYNSEKYQSIKSALEKPTQKPTQTASGPYGEILKLKVGNTYTLRLLPSTKDEPFFGFQRHTWDSFKTGELISVTSLKTFGENDPINSNLFLLKKKGTPEDQEKAKSVRWSQQWYTNVYVIDDPTNPENNGKVKILRFGKKIHEKFIDAIKGDSSDEFGERVFDLSPNGVNFKLKVDSVKVNGTEVNNYDNSRFTSPINLKLSDEQCDEIYGSVHDIFSIEQRKTAEELKQIWEEHYLNESLPTKQVQKQTVKEEKSESKSSVKASSVQQDDEEDLSDDEVAALLSSSVTD